MLQQHTYVRKLLAVLLVAGLALVALALFQQLGPAHTRAGLPDARIIAFVVLLAVLLAALLQFSGSVRKVLRARLATRASDRRGA